MPLPAQAPAIGLAARACEGNGNQIAETKLKPLNKDALAEIYRDPDFVPSLDIDHIGPALQ